MGAKYRKTSLNAKSYGKSLAFQTLDFTSDDLNIICEKIPKFPKHTIYDHAASCHVTLLHLTKHVPKTNTGEKI